jgi:hypothetical protein
VEEGEENRIDERRILKIERHPHDAEVIMDERVG